MKITATAMIAALGLLLPLQAGAQTPGFLGAEFVRGWQTGSGSQMFALRVRLEDGWKTYWRSPGDVGVPPQFDWSGTRNAESITVHWPTPTVFESYGLRTVGYAGEMVLPVEITPQAPGAAVTVTGAVSIGICREICVPVFVDIDTVIEGPGAASQTIAAALAARPELLPGGARCRFEPVLDGARVTAEMRVPPLGGKEIALIEMENAWVSDAESRRQGETLISSADIVPFSPSVLDINPAALIITVLGANGAVEIRGCQG
jgi:hypothetical protein